MVVTEDEINEEFEDFDIKITNDAVSEKLIDLCSSHRLDAGRKIQIDLKFE